MRERYIIEDNEKSLTEEEKRLPLFPELLNSDGSIGFDISSKIRQIKDRQAKGVPMDDKFVNEIDNYSNEALEEFKQKMAQELPPVLQEKVNEAFDRLSSPENLNKVLDAILPMIFKQGMAEISAYLVADLLTNFLGAELLGTMLPAITRGELICIKPCHKKNKTQYNDPCEALRRQWKENRCDQKGYGTHQGVQANMTIISRDTSFASGMSRTLNRNFYDEEDYADSPGRTPYAGRRADADSPGRTPWAGRRTRSAGPGPGGRSPRSKSPKGRFPEECIDTCPCMRQ